MSDETMPSAEYLAKYFWTKVDKTDSCWLWTGTKDQQKYGTLTYRRGVLKTHASKRAHRLSYELLVGPIPAGLVLDHLCRNTSCVNPAHLEPVTVKENVQRGYISRGEPLNPKPGRIGAPYKRIPKELWKVKPRATHCGKGHEWTPENTYQNGSARHCRTCERAREMTRRGASKNG